MHSTDLQNTNVPAFLIKLWKIVEDPNTDNLIGWSASGNNFIIYNQSQFAKELLPLYFKHSNMASFVRQLNMYGFRKLSAVEQGSLRFDRDEMEFYHQHFIKGRFSNLANIKRKISTSKTSEGKVKPEILREVLSDVNSIRTEQENVDSLLKSMKEENTALWREVAILRQKHLKQQQIVEKLIHFLASLVNTNCKLGLKRKLPLMIGSGNSCMATESKIPRLSQQFPNDDRRIKSDYSELTHYPVTTNSPSGPVIHDVTDSLEEDASFIDTSASSVLPPKESALGNENVPSVSLFVNSPSVDLEPIIALQESPLSLQVPRSPQSECILPENESLEDKPLDTPVVLLDPLTPSSLFPNTSFSTPNEKCDETTSEETTAKNESESNNSQMQVAISTSSDSLTKNVFTDHLDNIETDLDWLQEQLSSGGLNIDSSTLLGVCSLWNTWGTNDDKLFGSDDSLGTGLLPYETEKEGNPVTGNELMAYKPSLDTDLLDSPFLSSNTLNDDLSSLPGSEVTDLLSFNEDL